MISKNILAVQIGILACSFTLAPCIAAPTTAKTKITKLKLSLNEVADTKNDRAEGPHLSDAELLKLAEMKAKFADNIAPKMAELHSLRRQMNLAMARSTLDRAQLLQLQSKINSANSDIANSRLSFQLDLNDSMPADAKERMRKHLLFDAAFGPDQGFGGPPPPGLGPPPTCVPPPGFGLHHPPFGPPPMMGFPPGLRPEGLNGPMPGRGPRGAPPAPPSAHSGPPPHSGPPAHQGPEPEDEEPFRT
ncbi:MAG: hypothetical protein JST89_17485 [Cyanobacteria bacterium SZAS-4]|nr:hypothetical protein [Cyanobacteria bacterium SZAS-4]